MSFLLDTHVFIWWTIRPNRLSEKASDLIVDPSNNLFLSLASVWEMQIKTQLADISQVAQQSR